MFGRITINNCLTNNILQSCSRRQYNIFRRPSSLTYYEQLLQAGRAPGANSNMPVGFPQSTNYPSKNFSFAAMRKHYGVLPIVTLMTGVMCGLAAFCIFAANTKDIIVTNTQKKPWEQIDLRNPKNRKLIKNSEYRPLPDLADLLEDMERSAAAASGEGADGACGPGKPCPPPPPGSKPAAKDDDCGPNTPPSRHEECCRKKP